MYMLPRCQCTEPNRPALTYHSVRAQSSYIHIYIYIYNTKYQPLHEARRRRRRRRRRRKRRIYSTDLEEEL